MKTTIDPIAQLQAEQAAELAELQKKLAIKAALPALPATSKAKPYLVCVHDTHVSASTEVDTLAQALAIMQPFEIVGAEAWKSYCVSVFPPEINRQAKEKGATLQFPSYAEFRLHSYGEHSQHNDCELRFWARFGADLLSVSVKILRAPWHVSNHWRTDSRGNVTEHSVSLASCGEDSRLKWWSPTPCYSYSLHWSDKARFDAAMAKAEGAAK